MASIASVSCMIFISMPCGYISGEVLGLGLPGFWLGYGLSSFVLGSIYLVILKRVDWKATAL